MVSYIHIIYIYISSSQLNSLCCCFLFFQKYFCEIYQKKTYGFLFGFITLIITSYIFYKDKTIASMWCWVVNSVMVYYAVYLLFYLPFVL